MDKPTPKPRKMTDLEAAFIVEYLLCKNKTKAAIRAGYAPKNAQSTGSDVYQRPHVKAAIMAALQEQQTRTLIAADQVLLDINRLADKAALTGEYHAAIRGKELIGKHYKLFTEKHEHGGMGGGPVQFQITSAEAEH